VWNSRHTGAQLEAVDMAGVEIAPGKVWCGQGLVPHMAERSQRGEFHLPSSSREPI